MNSALGKPSPDFEDPGYWVVSAKLSKRDKDGNLITPADFGRGGGRRPDGTQSALTYDHQLLEESKDSTLAPPGRLQRLKPAAAGHATQIVVDVASNLTRDLLVPWLITKFENRRSKKTAPERVAETEAKSADVEDGAVDVAEVLEPGLRVSADQWRAALKTWVVLKAMGDHLEQALLHAEITGDETALDEIQQALRALAPDDRRAFVEQLLGEHPEWLTDEFSAKLELLIAGESPRPLRGMELPTEDPR